MTSQVISKIYLLGCAAVLLSGCSAWVHRPDSQDAPEQQNPVDPTTQKLTQLDQQNQQLKTTLTALSAKLDTMENQMKSISDKLDGSVARIDNLTSNQKAKPAPMVQAPTEGIAPLPPVGENEAEASFSSKLAVQKFRESTILFESGSYPEAILGFSAFVEQYPDHPLAGSAQYYLGESYFKQKDYKNASKELQRVLTSYDRSPHVTETLRDLAVSEENLGNSEDANRHRQLLTSLFPQSPAAAGLRNAPTHPAPHETKEEAEKEATTAPAASSKLEAGEAKQEKADAKEDTKEEGGESNAFPMEKVRTYKAKANPPASSANALDSPPPTAPIAPAGTPQ